MVATVNPECAGLSWLCCHAAATAGLKPTGLLHTLRLLQLLSQTMFQPACDSLTGHELHAPSWPIERV
eukprot:SAG31_NODE_1530_length_7993_cov_7.079807_4_plen_68_part_00